MAPTFSTLAKYTSIVCQGTFRYVQVDDTRRRNNWRQILCGLLLLLFVATVALGQSATRDSIRVVMDDNYPPFVFRDDRGNLQGILIDQWRLWEIHTGIHAEITAMDWSDALRRMRAGEFDVIDTIFKTDERSAYFDFTQPYARLEVPVFFDKDISGITDLASLKGFAVAAKKGDAAVDLLTQNGITNLLLFSNYQSIVAAAKDRKVNVFVVDLPPALYFLNKLGINTEFRHSPPLNVGEFHRAVKRGDRALLQTVEQGFGRISAADLKRIDEKWYGTSIAGVPYLKYLGYGAGAALLFILGLLLWNRALSRVVVRRTAALAESEERFRQVVENIEEVFWMTDVVKGQMLYISPGYEKIWGRSCASLYQTPNNWMEAVRQEDRERVWQAAQSKQASGDYNEEYQIIRPDGSVRWIRDRAFPIRDPAGQVFRIAGVAEDITEQRTLEEQFRQSQKMEAIGALAGGIAHDFNNILSVINGNAELALQDLWPESPVFESLSEILKASNRARNLVQQILTFTRLQQLDRHVIALAPVVEETADFLRATLPPLVDLSIVLDTDTANVRANATQIQQVLLNIFTNAWHALEAQPGRIDVQLRNVIVDAALARAHDTLQPGLYACLSVSDTGKGMDDVTMQRIFEPFFSSKPQNRGTGLGLSIAQGIMKAHEGAIVVSSELHKGTTFQLYFPTVAEAIEAISPPQETSLQHGHGQHIWYLDDEEPLVLLATRMLERLGYVVSGFTDTHTALATFRTDPHRFDLAVTDYNMPGTTGLEAAGMLMTIRPDMPVILTSGYVTDDLIAKARRIGIRQVIDKPNTVKELCDAVQAALYKPTN